MSEPKTKAIQNRSLISSVWSSQLGSALRPLFAVAMGLLVGLIFVQVATGESALRVFEILISSAFGSPYAFGMTLFYATPLLLTGLSVSLAFHAGLFNIGAEGQLNMGALGAAAVGIAFPHLPWPWAPALAITVAFACGAIWGAIPGWLRAYRGAHEVINTIMLNFIAYGWVSWVTLYVLKNPENQNPETLPIGEGYWIQKLTFLGDAPLSTAIFLALGVAVLLHLILKKSLFGFELKAVGQNEAAAQTAGIQSKKMQFLAMTFAGGIAGLVGVGEVLGHSGKFKLGFSPDYGFMGIAVALLARNQPLAVIFSAFLFGALHKGTADLDLETDRVTRDLSLILQATIILSVAADGLWEWKKKGLFFFRRTHRVQNAISTQESPHEQ